MVMDSHPNCATGLFALLSRSIPLGINQSTTQPIKGQINLILRKMCLRPQYERRLYFFAYAKKERGKKEK